MWMQPAIAPCDARRVGGDVGLHQQTDYVGAQRRQQHGSRRHGFRG